MTEQRYFEMAEEVVGYVGTVIHLSRVVRDCMKEKKELGAPISPFTEDRIGGMLEDLWEEMEQSAMMLGEWKG
jgi:hypothetical protein